MDPVTASLVIQHPQERVFAYLADIANHAGILDHRFVDWHLTREDSIGVGAGARFKIRLPFNRFSYFDVTLVDVESPHRIAYVGRGGKYDRTPMLGEITLRPESGGACRVTWRVETEPGLPSDRLAEAVGGQRGRVRRGLQRGLHRLRAALEDGVEGRRGSTGPVGVAGGPRKPASGFRLGTQPDAGRLD
ncbi:MAG: SRPBCC family protein [Solirubrobacteraceae bacterium]|nr:SRPBCC family protein [Solirubrobacteraceae bacterium]